ncbi:MAG: dTDP-4-dehydrorhamnose 3,5-epimerase [Verrucomicrobiota bacterium]|nr:dTDP-4-dehydrorhamnose 3,5-epimerase [Verrucomicrobiota bacterium]
MIYQKTIIEGAWLVELNRLGDDRGFFARAWCREEFENRGITVDLRQANMSFSAKAGTLRGMHFQRGEDAEMKLVRCVRGAIFDVVLDLRKGSPTFGRWEGVELTAENRRMLVVPEGCAHGFQTLVGDSEVFYLVSAAYAPESEGGVRWDDPAFGIKWPLPVSEISAKDAAHPDFRTGVDEL